MSGTFFGTLFLLKSITAMDKYEISSEGCNIFSE